MQRGFLTLKNSVCQQSLVYPAIIRLVVELDIVTSVDALLRLALEEQCPQLVVEFIVADIDRSESDSSRAFGRSILVRRYGFDERMVDGSTRFHRYRLSAASHQCLLILPEDRQVDSSVC